MGASISQPIQPTQRGAIIYNVNATVDTSFRNKNSFVVLGRELTNPGASAAAAAGCIVAAYLNATTYINSGTYHNYLYGTSSGSPAFTQYSSGGTSYGRPVDLLALTDNQLRTKIIATVRKIRTDFPFINAIFADDSGPSWTGYDSLSASVHEQFYQKQIVMAQAYRDIGDELGMLMMTNGEWKGYANFGYPTRNIHGCSLYDGFCIEHHSASEINYWLAVGDGQWRVRDPQGQRLMFFIANDSSQFTAYRNARNIAWIGQQTTPQYTANPLTATPGPVPHDLGLSFTGATPTITVSVSPVSVTVQTGSTQTFTGSASNAATLTWKVNGVTGGNSTVGTVSPTTGTSVTYTAPVGVPSGGSVTVNASVATGQNASSNVAITTVTPPTPDSTLPAPPAITNKAFGNRFSGTIPNNMTNNYARGTYITAPEDGTVNKLVFGVDGAGPGTADEPLKLALYAVDSNGNGGALIDSTPEYVVTSGLSPQWVSISFNTPVSVTANTTYLAVIHSGGTEVTARFYRNDVANQSLGLSDTYADGEIATFAGASVGSADISIYADYTPAGTVTNHMQMNTTTNLNFAFDADTVSPIGVSSVMAILVPVTRTVPIIYEDLGDGVPGDRLTWNNSTLQYEKAT